MLRAVATSAAQVRRGLTAARDAGLDTLAEDGRPRAVVLAGMGGSGIAGDVVAAMAGTSSPVPVVVHRGPGLPGWVGAADLVCRLLLEKKKRNHPKRHAPAASTPPPLTTPATHGLQ